jgi:hypothetical protein
MSDAADTGRDDKASEPPLFTRAEALGSISARRARALLFLIEYWSARLAWQARRRDATLIGASDLSFYAPILVDERLFRDEADGVENDPEEGFYRAFGLTREGLPPATPRQIEEYAPEWARLVPDNSRLRAQVGRLLLQKYRMSLKNAVRLRAALGLDTEPVQEAYRSLYRESVFDSFAPAPASFGDRLRGLFGRR